MAGLQEAGSADATVFQVIELNGLVVEVGRTDSRCIRATMISPIMISRAVRDELGTACTRKGRDVQQQIEVALKTRRGCQINSNEAGNA